MSHSFDYPKLFIHMETTHAAFSTSEVQIALRPAADPIVLGEPGEKSGQILLQHTPEGNFSAVLSLGKAEKAKAETFRAAGGALAGWLEQNKVSSAGLDVTGFDSLKVDGALAAFCEGLLLGAFRFDRYKKKESETPDCTFTLHTAADDSATEALLREVQIVTDSVNLARDWGHEPANVINPVSLAERIADLAKDAGLRCTILDEAKLSEMGAGGIVQVGIGSKTPARMILIEYPGKDVPADTKPVVLVGKALTFDSGGYSIKPSDGIQGMKYDKCGAMAVIATLTAAAKLELSTPLVGVICAAENMVSQFAYRPDDILTTLSGKTVEIVTTDAEGRLVLADGLTYAQRTWQPRAVIDLATLTGGVVVALGRVRGGLFANNDELAVQLFNAGETVHERLWRLPMDEDYLKSTKGDEADLKNSGGREGHPIMGGIFLKQFIENDNPWAHLDIAGVADSPKDLPYCQKGATGFGVRLLVEYLKKLA